MARGGLLVVVVLLVAMVSAAAALSNSRFVETFPVAGLKCKLWNVPLGLGRGWACPEANPNTVTFCKKGSRLVHIVGNFQAANLGVCKPSLNPFSLMPSSVVKYEQYADHVILRIFYGLSTSFRCLLVDGKKVFVGLSSRAGVSYATDCVPANC